MLRNLVLVSVLVMSVSAAAIAQEPAVEATATTTAEAVAAPAQATSVPAPAAAPVATPEAPKVKKMWGDINGDDRISKDEYMETYSKTFTKIDANGDGFITRDEKEAATAKAKPEEKESFFKRFFKK